MLVVTVRVVLVVTVRLVGDVVLVVTVRVEVDVVLVDVLVVSVVVVEVALVAGASVGRYRPLLV